MLWVLRLSHHSMRLAISFSNPYRAHKNVRRSILLADNFDQKVIRVIVVVAIALFIASLINSVLALRKITAHARCSFTARQQNKLWCCSISAQSRNKYRRQRVNGLGHTNAFDGLKAEVATCSAWLSARPTSSLAKITMRRATSAGLHRFQLPC